MLSYTKVDKNISDYFRKRCMPISTLIEITRKCNWKCDFCYLGNSRHKELDYLKLLNLLREIKDLGGVDVTFTGGEPLLYPHFLDVLNKAKKMGFVCNINTNGSCVNEENCKFLAEMISEFNISLHSKTPTIHDRITGKAGNWQKTVESIKLLKRHDAKIKINTVITKAVVDEIEEMKEFIRNELGCEWTPDTRISPSLEGDNSKQQLYQLNVDEIKEVLKIVKLYSYGDSYSNGICGAARDTCFINVDGYVYPCIEFANNGCVEGIERVEEKSFKNIWENNILFEKIRKISSEDFEKCIQCDNYKKCHKCIANNYRDTGKLAYPSNDICYMEMAYLSNHG